MGPSTAARPYRRRRYLVDRPLQLRLVHALLGVLCVMALAAMAAVYCAIRVTLNAFELSGDALIVSLTNTIYWTIALQVLLMVPIVFWFGIRLTHAIAGPLVRIYAALDQLAHGHHDVQVTLRRGDQLTGLAAAVNRLAAALRSRTP